MSPQEPPPHVEGASSREAHGDPWQAFGYIVAGVGFYGVVGWLLDRWLGTTFLVAIGVIVGAGLGVYLTIKSLGGTGDRQDRHHERGSTRTEE